MNTTAVRHTPVHQQAGVHQPDVVPSSCSSGTRKCVISDSRNDNEQLILQLERTIARQVTSASSVGLRAVAKCGVTTTLFAEQSANLAFPEIAWLEKRWPQSSR